MSQKQNTQNRSSRNVAQEEVKISSSHNFDFAKPLNDLDDLSNRSSIQNMLESIDMSSHKLSLKDLNLGGQSKGKAVRKDNYLQSSSSQCELEEKIDESQDKEVETTQNIIYKNNNVSYNLPLN